MTDYSHEERLCDSTVIESKARRRHIVMTSPYGEAKWRARPTTNDSDDNDGNEHENDEYEARRELGGFNDPSRRRERGYATRTAKTGVRRYESRESRVVKKTRFTLGGTNLEG